MSILDAIETDRLTLVPLPVEHAKAIVHGDRPPDARWAPGYPTDGTLVGASLVVTAEAEGQDLGPWTTYQIVRRSDGRVVGDCGFFGPPDENGDVQLAYGICVPERGQGYAGEAVKALIAWARTHGSVRRILADAARTNLDSILVMERAGMERVANDEQFVYYAA